MAGEKPTHRLVAKNKSTKESVEVGALWPAPFDGAHNVKLGGSKGVKVTLIVESEDGKEKVTADSHFLTLFKNEPKQDGSTPKRGRKQDDGEDMSSDEDGDEW